MNSDFRRCKVSILRFLPRKKGGRRQGGGDGSAGVWLRVSTMTNDELISSETIDTEGDGQNADAVLSFDIMSDELDKFC